MKIELTRDLRFGRDQSAEEYMRIVFAHISHEVLIKGVSSKKFDDNYENITVTYDKQPGCSDVDIESEIKEAISLRGNLTLKYLDVPARAIEIPGLRLLKETEDGKEYHVTDFFAKYLANNRDICAKLKSQRVVDVKFELEEVTEDAYRLTGMVSTT